MPLPPLDPSSADVVRGHLLVLPGDVGPDEVEMLAASRFPEATWEELPTTVVPRPSGGARGLRLTSPPPGVLRLTPQSRLEGPFTIDAQVASELALPTSAQLAYVVRTPVDRGAPPWPTGGDRDGLRRAFPVGLPVGEEKAVVGWLVDAARRLGGGVRTAPLDDSSPAALLIPDPGAAVDLTVWTDIWLDPEAALAVMRQAVPRAALNLPVPHWAGPPAGTGLHAVAGTEDLDPEVRRRLHVAADEVDIAVLSDPPPMDRYGALVDLDLDGTLALEVSGETALPPVIAAVPWAAQGAVAYRVRWEPTDLHDRESERPSLTHRVARGRATPLVIAVTRALHGAVGGEITDMMDFVVDPTDL